MLFPYKIIKTLPCEMLIFIYTFPIFIKVNPGISDLLFTQINILILSLVWLTTTYACQLYGMTLLFDLVQELAEERVRDQFVIPFQNTVNGVRHTHILHTSV